MTFKFKHVAAATLAVASFASAQAATFTGTVMDSFKLDAEIASLLTSVTLSAQGAAAYDGVSKTLFLPATSTTLSNANAADLVTAASGSGLLISGLGKQITLSNLEFTNNGSNGSSIEAVISLNGVQQFSGVALASSAASTLGEAFNAATGDGLLTSGTMKMTESAAVALVSALGFPSFLAGAVTNAKFGTFTVAAVPEPETYALMGLGLVGIALAARKRQAA